MAFDLDIEGMVFEAARDGAEAQGSASALGRDRAVAPTLTEDDLELDFSLRPKRLDDYLGQTKVKESLGIMIAAAQGRGEPADHILFSGPQGWARPRSPRWWPTSWAPPFAPPPDRPSLARATWRPSSPTSKKAMCCSSTRSIA